MSPKIGKFAIDQMAAQLAQEEEREISNRTQAHVVLQPITETQKLLEQSLFSNSRYSIDFTPLFQCLHINKELGLLEQFRNAYRENRQVCPFFCEFLFQKNFY